MSASAGRVIVFDFDGTITDILAIAPGVVNRTFAEIGMPAVSREELEDARQLTALQAIMKFKFPPWKLTKAVKVARREMYNLRADIKPVKGMVKLIKDLDKDSNIEAMYILTASSAGAVDEFLEKNKIAGCFEEVVSELGIFNKPSKLAGLIRRHGHDVSTVCIVGDEIRDMTAGDKAGVTTVAVTWGLSHPDRLREAKTDYLASSAAELRKVLK